MDNQRGLGEACCHMDWSAAEDLLRECEAELGSERDELATTRRRLDRMRAERNMWCEACAGLQAQVNELSAQLAEAMLGTVPPAECPPASDGLPLRIGETVWGQDGKAWRLTAVGPTHVFGRATGSKNDKRLRPEWLTHERPDSWERVEQDAVGIDAAQGGIFRGEARTAAIVARCKRLAGVE